MNPWDGDDDDWAAFWVAVALVALMLLATGAAFVRLLDS